MSERSFVVVSRRWDDQKIEVVIDGTGILVAMPLEDYLKVLAMEIGTPGAHAALTQAAERVIAGMKDETARVM